MSVPTLSRRWYSRGNIPLPDVSTATNMSKSFLWAIKAALLDQLTTGTLNSTGGTGFTRPAQSVWTHVASADGIGGYTATGTDIFGGGATFDATKVITVAAEGTNHSWICLRTNVAATGWQNPIWMLINCVGTDYARTSVLFSTSAPVGGSATTAPTFTESWGACGLVNGYGMVGVYVGSATVDFNNMHFVCDDNGMWFIATNLIGDTVLGRFRRILFCVDAIEANTNDIRRCTTTVAEARGTFTYNYSGAAYESASDSLGGRKWDNSGSKAKYVETTNLHSGGGFTQWGFGGCFMSTIAQASPSVLHGYTSSTQIYGSAVSQYAVGAYASCGLNTDGWTSVVDPSSSSFWALPAYMMDLEQSTVYQATWRGKIPDFYKVPQGISGFSYPATTAPTMHVIGNALIPLSVVPIT